MEPDFWHERWKENRIGFHQQKINSRLKKLWPVLEVPAGARILVPLCGKTLDMLWLRDAGHEVLGVELSAEACAAFFEENELPCARRGGDRFEHFTGEGIELLAGNFFTLGSNDTADIAAAYDRAALVAMPAAMRPDYANHLAELLPKGSQVLLISMDYDQQRMDGPPFAVPENEVRSLFSPAFDVEIIATSSGPDIVGNLAERGLDTLEEKVYRLVRRRD